MGAGALRPPAARSRTGPPAVAPNVTGKTMSFLSLSARALAARPRANPDEVRPGECFRGRQETPLSQTATVLELREAVRGIPHVLFKVAIACSDASRLEEASRILAIESFLETFPEHVI